MIGREGGGSREKAKRNEIGERSERGEWSKSEREGEAHQLVALDLLVLLVVHLVHTPVGRSCGPTSLGQPTKREARME